MPDRTPASTPNAPRRRAALACVIGAVVLAHALITQAVVGELQGLGDGAEQAGIKRMQATLVAEMRLSAPPVVIAPPPPPPPLATPMAPPAAASVASAPSSAASRPDHAQSAPEPASSASGPTDLALAPASATEPPSSPMAPASTASAASAPAALAHASAASSLSLASASAPQPAASAASTFEWPLATRVTFKAQGYIRGPIYGQAQVEWVRQGLHYQVHVDASVGPSFAPLGSQRWTSEGEISPLGLEPRRFESVNKLLIASGKPKLVIFRKEDVELANGDRVPKLPMVQDPASHYIQLAYQALLDPTLVRVGGTITMPVALTKKQIMLVYDVLALETLETPMGKVDAFKLRPRPQPDQKEKDEILAEIWIAPSLQYMPIRMLLRHGEKNYLDMTMDKLPQQTEATPGADVAPAEK